MAARSKKRTQSHARAYLTPELQAQIVQSLEIGNYLDVAAAQAGVYKPRVLEWLRKGARGQQPYADFADAVRKAQNRAESELVRRHEEIIRAALDMGDPKALAVAERAIGWRLERKYPKRWGKQVQVLDSSEDPTRQAYEAMSDDELEREVTAALKRRNSGDDGNDSDSDDDDEPASDGDPEDA